MAGPPDWAVVHFLYDSAQLTRCRGSKAAHLFLQLLLLCCSCSLCLCCLAPGLLKRPQGGLLLGLFSCYGPEQETSLAQNTINLLCRHMPRRLSMSGVLLRSCSVCRHLYLSVDR